MIYDRDGQPIRLNAYCTPMPDGTFQMDIEGALIDLVAFLKTQGCPPQAFYAQCIHIWENTEATAVPFEGTKKVH